MSNDRRFSRRCTNRGTTAVETEFLVDENRVGFEPLQGSKLLHLKGFHNNSQPSVHLSFVDLEGWRFISMTGRARIVRDVKKKRELWMDDLKRWFEEGPESDEIVLIKVTPRIVPYWTKTDEGELQIR